MTFTPRTREATVVFDPSQVRADEVRAAVRRANDQMGRPDQDTAASADLIL